MIVVHSDYGTLYNTKKKWAIKPWKIHGWGLNAYYKVKEATLEDYILYNILEEANYEENKKISGYQEWEGKEMNR